MALEIWPKIGLSGKIRFVECYLMESDIPVKELNAANEDRPEGLPLLPPSSGGDGKSFEIGTSLKLDEWGPIIINTDGTTRRIANWDTLSPQEKESSWRLISKRNKQRLEALKRLEVDVSAEQQEPLVDNKDS